MPASRPHSRPGRSRHQPVCSKMPRFSPFCATACRVPADRRRSRRVSFDPEAVRDFEHAGWQRAAASYSATFARATSGFIASLLDAARVGSGSRVLDLACGPGLVAAVARQRGAVAIGLDFSAAMIALARAEIPVSASRKATRKRCRLPTVRSTPSCRISESITCRMLFGHYRRLVGFYARVVGLGSPAGQYPPRTSPGRFSSMRSPRMDGSLLECPAVCS